VAEAGLEGIEDFSNKTGDHGSHDAESSAVRQKTDSAANSTRLGPSGEAVDAGDPRLLSLISVWPNLPEDVQQQIFEMATGRR
jgi:hypothetical protein